MDFARTLVGDFKVADMLEELCDAVGKVLAVDGAGVMLSDDEGILRFVAASDETVRHIEALQIELGEGPCLHAFDTGDQVVVADLENSERFPKFTPRALEAGMRAVFSFPMRVDSRRLGALNLYRGSPRPFEVEDIEAGQVLADIATTYILNVRLIEHSTKLTAQLERALQSRVVIEQAKGMLAEQRDIDVVQAFELLRSYARNNGRKLHDVARAVVAGDLQL